MVDILVITHAQDRLLIKGRQRAVGSRFMAGPILGELARMGHRITVGAGIPEQPARADLAFMHVDLTIVPPEYMALGSLYPVCLNIGARDISKRTVSGARITPGEAWDGQVIVKSNLNFRGIPEARLGIGPSTGSTGADYAIHASLGEVPPAVLADPALVVEKFLPERTGDGYAVRFWTFTGDAERCARVFSREPIVKSSNAIGFEFCEVPDRLRGIRAALGFDYGKFDFVMHEGEPVLLDANKTPGLPPTPKGALWPRLFAEGLLGCLR